MINNVKSWKTTAIGIVALIIVGIFAIKNESVSFEMLISGMTSLALIFMARDSNSRVSKFDEEQVRRVIAEFGEAPEGDRIETTGTGNDE